MGIARPADGLAGPLSPVIDAPPTRGTMIAGTGTAFELVGPANESGDTPAADPSAPTGVAFKAPYPPQLAYCSWGR